MTGTDYIIRRADNSDQDAWDHFVSSHPETSPYHLFAWKKAVEQAYGHKGIYLVAEQGNAIVGVLPIIHIRLPFLLQELTALPFCDVGNVLAENEQATELLLHEALRLGVATKTGLHLRGNIPIPNSLTKKIFHQQTDKVRMLCSLPPSSEELLAGFKSKLRSQIKKAEKNGLSFSWGGQEHIHQFYAVFTENMRDLGSPTHSRTWFSAILRNYGKNCALGIVKYGDKVVGGGLILTVADRVSIPWASTLRSYNKLAPNMLLYWNILKYAADAGYTTFDFGRSSLEEGTYKFKKQWGAEPHPLNWYSSTPPKTPATASASPAGKGKRQLLAETWAKLPLPLANFLGPRIRKYISL
jgi:FemAB-related protein (PEP-CTERM system-associated)